MAMAQDFCKGGQSGWYYDLGHWSGFFHTYDALQLGGLLAQPRKVHVFLPRDYEVSQASYPVLYLNDGDSIFFPGGAYQKSWNLANTLNRLYLTDQICKIIVVAVCPLNRDYEYTHAPHWDRDWGGLADYSTYLAQSLKGFIDHQYRTLADPSRTLMAGASHGGLAAFYTAAQYPDQFGGVAALSPSFWVGLDSTADSWLLQSPGLGYGSLGASMLLYLATPALQDQRVRIYLDWGLIRDGGFHNDWIEERAATRGREMRDLLVQTFGYCENETLFCVEDPLGQHGEDSWARRMESILKIFFGF